MNLPVSARDIYDLVNRLNEKDLFGLYESSFNEAKKKFPLIDEKESPLSQRNEDMRYLIGDIEMYKDVEGLKSEIFDGYYKKVKGEIPKEVLQSFLNSLFKTLEEKIRSHPKIRGELDHELIKDSHKLLKDVHKAITQPYQCAPHGMIQTPEGMCGVDILTRGFLGKFRLVLGSHYRILGEMNHKRVLELVEKMDGDPDYPIKNPDLASEVCKILIESFDHISRESNDTKIAFSIILSKLTRKAEFLEQCELPSSYDEFNFQAYYTLSVIKLNLKEIDSAKRYLEKAKNTRAKDKVLALILEGRILMEEYCFDEAIECFMEAMDNADFYRKKVILFHTGLAYYNKSNPEKSLEYWKELERIEDRKKEISSVIGNIGLAYLDLGELEEAVKCFKDALKMHRKLKDIFGEANSLKNIGVVYQIRGEFNDALSYHEKALELDRKVKNRIGEADDLNNIGLVYHNLGELNEALKYFQEAIEIHKEMKNRIGEADALSNMASIYKDLGEFDKSLEYLEKSLRIYRKMKNRIREAGTLTNIGIIYITLEKFDKSLEYLEKSLKMHRKTKNRRGEAIALSNIEVVLKIMGKKSEALDYFNKASDF